MTAHAASEERGGGTVAEVLWAFLLLAPWGVPPWLVVILGAVAASAVAML